jgi:hypothetical protein
VKTVVIWPNNTVEVNGHEVKWDDATFARHGIEKTRVRQVPVSGGAAEVSIRNGVKYMVFPTKEEASFDVRANVDLTGVGGHQKQSAGRPSRRRMEIRGGVMWLECRGRGTCGAMKPAEEFYKAARLKFGRMGPCKECWNRYLTAYKRRTK